MTANLRNVGRQRPDRLFVPDKDPAYEYRWLNNAAGPQGDQNMYMAQWEGWEPAPMDPKLIPPALTDSTLGGGGGANGTVHRRGDLVLYRMKREAFEANVRSAVEEQRSRAESTLDTMVTQAQERAAKSLRDAGVKRVPGNLVFREDVGDPVD